MRENPAFDSKTSDFAWLLGQFMEIINVLIIVVFALTVTFLIWKIISVWILHGYEESEIQEGKNTIFFGFIALVVMASVWGIVALLRSSII